MKHFYLFFQDGPTPRLCILSKWSSFKGYGFNLHAEKNKPGQYIGSVDQDSPGAAAGLRKDDKIIEVRCRRKLSCTSYHSKIF